MISDPENQERCCHENTECLAKWKNTKLIILTQLPPNDQTAYKSGTHDLSVSASVAKIANCRSKGCINYLFNHELGHACHQAGHTQPTYELKREEFKEDLTRATQSQQGANCILDSLDRENLNIGREHYVLHWYEEALANVRFFEKSSAETPGYLCGCFEDIDHGAFQVYASCISLIPKFKSKICPNGSAKGK